MATTMALKRVPLAALYESEPNPMWFGNRDNELDNRCWDTGVTKNWLKSRFHFSFAEHYDGRNVDFGVLRVMNDDFVQPDSGFGTHPHRDMEIITYICSGRLTHRDSTGTDETLGRGSVQFMTAGRGIMHSEHNLEKDRGLRFVQVWITLRARGLPANYGSFDPETDKIVSSERNLWRHVMSDAQNVSKVTPVKIQQDANLFTAEIDTGRSLDLHIAGDRMAYVLLLEGSVSIHDSEGGRVTLVRHDGCEVTPVLVGHSTGTLKFEAMGSETVEDGSSLGAHMLVFEMAHVRGAGRTDL